MHRGPAYAALLVSVSLLVLGLATACSPGVDVPKAYTRRVGEGGGTIADPGGCTLVVPAGALSATTALTVTTYQDTVDLGTRYPSLAGALCGVTLEPEGTTFAVPVTLRVTPSAPVAVGTYPLFTYDGASSKWVQTGTVTTNADGSYLEGEISHFLDDAIFDMPYDVLDDFDEFVTERSGDYEAGLLGDMYGTMYIGEEEGFVGPDQYYSNCCYMRAGAEMTIQYTYQGSPHTGYWTEGSTSESKSYTLSYSYSSDTLTYSIDLTVYLSCSEAESNIWISAVDKRLEQGQSTEVYGTCLCGESQTPVPGRTFTFTLSGPGSLSRTSAVTDAAGEATIEYTAGDDGVATITAVLEGCTCGAQLDLNPLETRISVGNQELVERWSGSLTLQEHGEGRNFEPDYGSSTFIIYHDCFCTVDASLSVDFTFDLSRDYDGSWSCSNLSGSGTVDASVVPGSTDWTKIGNVFDGCSSTDYRHCTYTYSISPAANILSSIDITDSPFSESGVSFRWSGSAEYIIEVPLDVHYVGNVNDDPGHIKSQVNDDEGRESVLASDIGIFFGAPLSSSFDDFPEGTLTGDDGGFLSISGYTENHTLSWSLSLRKLEDE